MSPSGAVQLPGRRLARPRRLRPRVDRRGVAVRKRDVLVRAAGGVHEQPAEELPRHATATARGESLSNRTRVLL